MLTRNAYRIDCKILSYMRKVAHIRFTIWHPPGGKGVRNFWVPMLGKLKEENNIYRVCHRDPRERTRVLRHNGEGVSDIEKPL
ncbi:MAG: hypothetical protein QXH20_02070 [Candidatus Bathyarchaeia archaeon]